MLTFLLLIFKGYVRLIQEMQLSHSSSDRERVFTVHINDTFYTDRFLLQRLSLIIPLYNGFCISHLSCSYIKKNHGNLNISPQKFAFANIDISGTGPLYFNCVIKEYSDLSPLTQRCFVTNSFQKVQGLVSCQISSIHFLVCVFKPIDVAEVKTDA